MYLLITHERFPLLTCTSHALKRTLILSQVLHAQPSYRLTRTRMNIHTLSIWQRKLYDLLCLIAACCRTPALQNTSRYVTSFRLAAGTSALIRPYSNAWNWLRRILLAPWRCVEQDCFQKIYLRMDLEIVCASMYIST